MLRRPDFLSFPSARQFPRSPFCGRNIKCRRCLPPAPDALKNFVVTVLLIVETFVETFVGMLNLRLQPELEPVRRRETADAIQAWQRFGIDADMIGFPLEMCAAKNAGSSAL
jgi:hypothetical protein